jgi:hypothetical protein
VGCHRNPKVGYASLTSRITKQVAKDIELISGKDIQGATWHFYTSPVTGLGGPSAPLREFLENNGISVLVH